MNNALKNPLPGLAHKRALVTGAARGIGAAIAVYAATKSAMESFTPWAGA